MNYEELASKEVVNKTAGALREKGYDVVVVEKGEQALEKIKQLIPSGSSVMNGSSVTLEEIGYSKFLATGTSGWQDLRAKVIAENDPQKRRELRIQASSADFYLGSVHALTQDGRMIIASNSGSQLPNIVFNSRNIIFVIGTQKIVPDMTQAMKRLEDYVFPLEDKRLKSVYNVGSNISKVLIFNKEIPVSGRKIHIILVNEKLGF